MSVKSLPVKYRPQTFEDVCSQEAVIKILTRQLETNSIKNCYLFCGPSGTGKTTIARIFANAINKGVGNPIEIDGASNNGVDNVKQICKSAQERAIEGTYKIYIIDETHALSNQAWQAFLKTIEEPPKYTIFMFCTTDPQKIPATILNRVMRFNLTRIKTPIIKDRLKRICECEQFNYDEDSIDYMSRISEGGMRYAISLLEKVASYNPNITIQTTLQALGNYSYEAFFKLLNAIIDGKEDIVYQFISYYYDEGNDLKLFVDQFLAFMLDVAKYGIFHSCEVTRIPAIYEQEMITATNFEHSSDYFNYYVEKLLSLKMSLKNDSSPRSTIEVMLIQMTRLK